MRPNRWAAQGQSHVWGEQCMSMACDPSGLPWCPTAACTHRSRQNTAGSRCSCPAAAGSRFTRNQSSGRCECRCRRLDGRAGTVNLWHCQPHE